MPGKNRYEESIAMLNPYESIDAKVEDVINETALIKTFVLKLKEKMLFLTGQFVEFGIKGFGEAPFTPSSSPYQTEYMEITIMKAGSLTERIHNLKKSAIVQVRGPYGKGYPIERMHGKEMLIVGGGVGMAPLRSFLLTLLAQRENFKRVILCYGAKTPQDIIYKDQFAGWMNNKNLEVYRSVDKADSSWKESTGVVPVLLDKVKVDLANSVAVVCGPPIMMKFVTLKLLQLGYAPQNIYLSMEKNMSCGLGKCGHCGIGRYYVCQDGPVFTYEQLKDNHEIWD